MLQDYFVVALLLVGQPVSVRPHATTDVLAALYRAFDEAGTEKLAIDGISRGPERHLLIDETIPVCVDGRSLTGPPQMCVPRDWFSLPVPPDSTRSLKMPRL